MQRIRISFALILVLLSLAGSAYAVEHREIMQLFERTKAAIDSGDIVPERDLAPLIAMLKKTKSDPENRQRVIERIGDIGASDGSSPVAVKRYLLGEATPILVEVAEDRSAKLLLRGDAISALRQMGAPRSLLEKIAAMALADPDEYVKSRGDILQNYIASMPAESKTENIRPVDAAKEKESIAFLKQRKLGVSIDQLRGSALEGKSDEVSALLGAGVDPNSGPAEDSPLNRALSGCSHAGGESDELVKTVEVLLAAGADVKRKDDNANTPLLRAGQYCGSKITLKLIEAGADVNAVNGSGITALSMALIMNRLDAAETLVAKGARLTAEQAAMASGNTDPRVKAILQRATAKKKK